jgi:hypothetical protein
MGGKGVYLEVAPFRKRPKPSGFTVHENTISHRSLRKWSMEFVGAAEIESRMSSSAIGSLMSVLTESSKSKPLSFGLNAFVSIYNQTHKSPYR